MDAGVERARQAVTDAVARLSDAGARDEALARYVGDRRTLGIRRAPRMESIGRVWRLGTLLVARDGSVFATGALTRALPPGRPAFQSLSAEERRDYRAAAHRGRFVEGEAVNFDATPIPLDETLANASGPIVLRDDEPMVRWSAASDALVPLADYLRDRVDLLVHPPQGA
ncbi:hypothetical protein E6C70_09445 [Glaciibacter flavus]|uniref:Glutaminase n=1 Tax=Orlajensenia flava TaxID=2565934 RepID=A0A4S4FXQ0_9MICO|nr:hypothetical protein [Glaciibacter flavus]THG34476.1 hypothetical protein E6C70_09445 [Glaciibacter flavus]